MKENKEKRSVNAEEQSDELKDLLRKRQRRLFRLLMIFPVFVSMIIAIVISILSNPENKIYVEKAPIKEIMCNTIKNGGMLSSVKHIYNTRNVKNVLFINPLSDKRELYYLEDYPLSGILNDLLVDYLQDSKSRDSIYYMSLCNIIEENEKQNPFENLEDNQKYSFENIQVKLDSAYAKVSSDVVKIAEELNNKNQLVNKYLNKSDISFYMSIAALVITIVFSAFQIYQNNSTSKVLRIFLMKFSNEDRMKKDEK